MPGAPTGESEVVIVDREPVDSDQLAASALGVLKEMVHPRRLVGVDYEEQFQTLVGQIAGAERGSHDIRAKETDECHVRLLRFAHKVATGQYEPSDGKTMELSEAEHRYTPGRGAAKVRPVAKEIMDFIAERLIGDSGIDYDRMALGAYELVRVQVAMGKAEREAVRWK